MVIAMNPPLACTYRTNEHAQVCGQFTSTVQVTPQENGHWKLIPHCETHLKELEDLVGDLVVGT